MGRKANLPFPALVVSAVSLDTDLCCASQTDRKAAVDGVFRRVRHHSPGSETHSALSQSSAGSGASTNSRRRSSRAKLASDVGSEYSSKSWLGAHEDDIYDAKRGLIAPRKSANHSSIPSSDHSSSDNGKEPGGFLPKLGRILEGKESKTARRKQGSTVSSMDSHASARRLSRSVESNALKTRSSRQKINSLHRVERNLASLQNPSLVSVLSGLTQQSNASNESNTTITQQSYDKKLITKRKPIKRRTRLQANQTSSTSEPIAMASLEPSVFQYMDQSSPGNLDQRQVPSSHTSSASSSAESEHDLSTAEEPVVESPPTSPASTRRAHAEDSYEDEEADSDDARQANSGPMFQPSVSEATSDSEEEADEDDEKDVESSSDSENERACEAPVPAPTVAAAARRSSPREHMALERVPPPRVPSSTSSRHSDRHTQRLKRQEQALAEHILQNPQPHRDFLFTGGPSPHFPPAMPLYDPYSQTGASPVNFTPTAPYPPPAAPPPQTIGYYSPPHATPAPYPPAYDNQFAMIARPPMAPSTVAQSSHVPYSPMQPPQHQVRPLGSDFPKPNMVGYELLADKLSESLTEKQTNSGEQVVVPMYRKFESLNHRVLLHLQDEIAELEEELRYLDESIAHCSPRDPAGRHHPASRRGDARYGGELHYRRTELLGRIYVKLGQYSKSTVFLMHSNMKPYSRRMTVGVIKLTFHADSALTSFNSMVKTLEPANREAVDVYRSWIEKHTPIDRAEARFLEHKNDLLTVSEGGSASIPGGVITHQSGAIWLPLVLVFPLLVFAIVPGLIGRLAILSLTCAATMKLITATRELMDMMTVRDWVRCLSA